MKKPLLLMSLILMTSCAAFKDRSPASLTETTLSSTLGRISSLKESLAQDHDRCANVMNYSYQELFDLVGSDAYLDMDNIAVLDRDIQRSFEARLDLREFLRDFDIKNSSDEACFKGIVDLTRALRYLEDYMIQIRLDKSNEAPTEYVNMQGQFPYLLVNPKYKDDIKSYEDLMSGDLILSRGGAYSSAAIARIGESDFQFSHLSFVYRDPSDNNKMYTTEAHIEIGAVTAPFEEHLNEKNVRSVVFRYNDTAVAHKASESIFKRVKAKSETGKNIEYDFSMNYKDESKLFCSEVISNGFHHVDPSIGYIPKFKSKFNRGLIPFLNQIGVPLTQENVSDYDVFAPGDIQFDPRFDLVLEWRNPKKIEESRIKDFILTKLFDKMEKEGYNFDPTLKMDVQTKSFWILRRIPIVRKFIEKKFPLNMTPTQMEIFMSLDKVGETIQKEIEKRSIESDHSLTPKEIYAAIDDFLEKDAVSPKPLLKKYFHK